MNDQRKSITAADVAREAGVSMSCAAAALRGSPTVKDSTRERILTIAERMGYSPNTAASVLASRRVRQSRALLQIGVLSADFINGRSFGPPPSVKDLFAKEAPGDWLFEYRNVASHLELRELTREWNARGFDGIIIWRIYPEFTELKVSLDQFAVVGSAHRNFMQGIDVVRCSHHFEQTRLLQRVQERGYRRVAMIWRYHTIPSPEDDARLAAMLRFQDIQRKEDRIPILRKVFPSDGAEWEREIGIIADYVEEHSPDALVSFNQSDGEKLKIRGIQIPRDIGYACFSCDVTEGETYFSALDEQYASVPYLLSHLSRKIHAGDRGVSSHPVEVVFPRDEFVGSSLPMRN